MCEGTCVPVCFPYSETPPRTLTDHRGMFNCRLLRPAVIGLICQGKASWEAGVRGVTPPVDDDHAGAAAKPAAGPVLLLWSFGILLLHRQFRGKNITALIML